MKPIDRFLDIQRQGFIKSWASKIPKALGPIVACQDCLNWHREGKHTASPSERRLRRAKAKGG